MGDLPDWDLPDWGAPIRGGRGGGGWAGGGRSKTLIGSASVAMAAAIVTIANDVMAAVVEPKQSWS
mgnify:CR=1 FL=1